jgi:hypothetical protein
VIPSRLRLKCGIAAVGAVLIVAGGGCSGDSAAPRQPGVSVNDLLAPVKFVPQNWPTEGWELYDTVALRQRFARTDEAMRRTWWVANSGARLVACCSSLVSVCCGIVGHAEPCADVAAG